MLPGYLQLLNLAVIFWVSVLSYCIGIERAQGAASPQKASQADQDPLGLKPKKLILSVGIGQFKDPIWKNLQFADKDAKNIYQFFKDFDGGQLLTSGGDSDSKLTTKSQLLGAFERLEKNNRNEGDTVIVYISTHGSLLGEVDGPKRFVITGDSSSKNLRQTAVAYDELIQRFKRLKSRKKVLILAFCYSGVGKSGLTPQMRREIAQMKGFYAEPIEEVSEGTIILTASGWREPAMESQALQNDIYTHFLIKGFTNDTNKDGAVTITEAHNFASNHTFAFTKGRQRPSAISELLGLDPIVISGKLKENRANLYAYFYRNTDYNIAVDGKNMGPISKGISLPEGKVRLQVTAADSGKMVLDRAVTIEPKREYPLAHFLTPTYPHSVAVGVSQGMFLDAGLRKAYAPDSTLGTVIKYHKDEVLGIFGGGVTLDYVAPVNETIEADGMKFEQVREMAMLSLDFTDSSPIDALSTQGQSVVTNLKTAIGPSLLRINRRIDDVAFYDHRQQGVYPGFRFGQMLEVFIPYNLVKVEVGVDVQMFRNFSDVGGSIMTGASSHIGVGGAW